MITLPPFRDEDGEEEHGADADEREADDTPQIAPTTPKPKEVRRPIPNEMIIAPITKKTRAITHMTATGDSRCTR